MQKIQLKVKEVRMHKVVATVDDETYASLKKNDSTSDEIAGDYTAGLSTMQDGFFELDDLQILE